MDSYRQSLESIGLSVERLTPNVPDDGWFYVVSKGKTKGRFRSLKQALACYKELVAESGWKPPVVAKAKVDPSVEAVERYMDELGDYWGSSHRHRRPGVKRA